jgi:hypothetical protein
VVCILYKAIPYFQFIFIHLPSFPTFHHPQKIRIYIIQKEFEFSGSHSGEYEGGCLLGCCALMMEAASTSETSVNFYQTTQRNNPEDSHLQNEFVECGAHKSLRNETEANFLIPISPETNYCITYGTTQSSKRTANVT